MFWLKHFVIYGDNAWKKKNKPDLVVELVKACDLFVDVATGIMHRVTATNSAIKELARAAGKAVIAGDLFVKEIDLLHRLLSSIMAHPEQSVLATGGSKLMADKGSEDIGKLEILSTFVDLGVRNILVSGRMVLPFLAAQGKFTGGVSVSEEELTAARAVLARVEAQRAKGVIVNLVLPEDYVTIATGDLDRATKDKDTTVEIQVASELVAGRIQLDIGPETRALFARIIAESEYGFANGPAGVFENSAFAGGTNAIATAIAAKQSGLILAGGGDTGAAMGVALKGANPLYVALLAGGGAPFAFIALGGKLVAIELMKNPR